jgi:hypothetical protein
VSDDPRIDPTPPVRRFAAHHLVLACALLFAVFGALLGYACDGSP